MNNLKVNYDNWILEETSIDPQIISMNETLFSLSNGHFGTRGSLEEFSMYKEAFGHSDASFVNGYYDIDSIQYGEWAYGYAEKHQTMIPVPNTKEIIIEVNNITFTLEEGTIHKHVRHLNLKNGILSRYVKWESPNGHLLQFTFERLVSYRFPEIFAQSLTVSSLTDDVDLKVIFKLDKLNNLETSEEKSSQDPRVKTYDKKRFKINKNLNSKQLDQLVHIETINSKLHLLIGNISKCSNQKFVENKSDSFTSYLGTLKKGSVVQFEQFTGYSSPFDHLTNYSEIEKKLLSQLKIVKKLTFSKVKNKHIEDMSDFWNISDIEITGDNKLQLGLRFNLFHLNQAAARDGKHNISAKGLTGAGYEGHYFWDTEIYMLPFFIYTQPAIARKLLTYRYSILDSARERAREMGVNHGALFAWRTINGKEASAYYPAGTAQIHINGAITNAVKTYVEATEDEEFKWNEGIEIVIEAARFYYNWGHFDSMRDHAFVLNAVTGPDEYTAIVNNNYYTNLIAKNTFKLAYNWVNKAKSKNIETALKIFEKLELNEEEIHGWVKAADKMYFPYDEKSKLSMQDDSFFHKKVWDFENTPEENYPLLLNYHPLTIYKHQVNKQADLVLAHLLFSSDFSQEQIARDYQYYESITTHDSSLSRSAFGIVASRLGMIDKSYNYFMDTALMDLNDMQNNTKDGVHAANMGGSWMSMVFGFGGMEIKNGQLYFSPRIPNQWDGLIFKIVYKNRIIQIKITQESTIYTLLKGNSIELNHFGNVYLLDNQLNFSS